MPAPDYNAGVSAELSQVDGDRLDVHYTMLSRGLATTHKSRMYARYEISDEGSGNAPIPGHNDLQDSPLLAMEQLLSTSTDYPGDEVQYTGSYESQIHTCNCILIDQGGRKVSMLLDIWVHIGFG